MSGADVERPEDRLTTGVPGLDTVLGGGLLRGGVYMVQGRPGAGKTILAHQVCFHHMAQGGQVLYVTLLAESHERLLFNMRPLTFFDSSRIPEQLVYLSCFSVLEEQGLKGLMDLLRREARTRRTSLLVVDGLVAVQESAESQQAFKKFIHELQVHAGLVGSTVLLLTSGSGEQVRPEHTMVDGSIELSDLRFGRRAERELEVKKFRGSGFLRGGHSFSISREGLHVYPRLEAVLVDPSQADRCKEGRLPTGVPGLDAMLGGGLPFDSTTVLLGPSGGGKTTLGLHFLDECSEEEPGLLFGFYETPKRIRLKSRALGLSLDDKLDRGIVEMLWYPPTERILDDLGGQLVEAVRRRGVRRLLVDGLDGFIKSAAYPERITHFFAALANELRVQGVTTLFTLEARELLGPTLVMPLSGISVMVENIILLRFVELRSQLYRLLSIVKVRDGDYDPALREFRISARGIELAETFESAEAILTGTAHAPSLSRKLPNLLRKRSKRSKHP